MTPFRATRTGFAWLVLAGALILRALIPSGWMPVADEVGIRVVICSGHGPVKIVQHIPGLHDGSQGHDGHGGSAPHDPCPFGLGLAKALDVPGILPEILSPEALAVLVGPVLVAARLTQWRSLRPPARGPPPSA